MAMIYGPTVQDYRLHIGRKFMVTKVIILDGVGHTW